MLLTIHDANLKKVAIIDNDKQETLNFFNDTWTRYLETGSSTFDFTVFKKAIISDTGTKRAYNYLNEKAFVSFEYKGKTYLHTIRKVEENEKVIKCYGVNLNLELINEYANPYKSSRAMSFQEFCEAMDLLNFTFLSIGINEISTKKITAEWEGSDTKLARLLSLAKKFGAEIEFDTYLKADSSIKSFVVNVYHEHDDQHQGVGRVQSERLTYGKNLKTITRTVDKTNIYNMVRPTGKTENGDVVTIAGLPAWSVNNAKGEREFYQSGEGLYAPLSMAMYPAAFTSGTMGDQWIRKDMSVESSSPEVIRSAAYRELKKNCYPAVTYEAEGFVDLEIGDTVQVYDDGFSPALLLEMRVSEQAISFTNKANNKTTFANAKALENRLSGHIQARLDQLIEDAKPYVVKLATDNGVAFKNQTGESVITPTLTKGGKQVECGWRWVVDGQIKSTSPTYLVRGRDVTDTLVVTVAAWLDNREVASEQLTFINTNDGRNGSNGINGQNGRDGRDGAKGDKGDKGERGDRGLQGERGPQGERGLQGIQGLQGPRGDQGIAGPKGADGRTQYTHIAYADTISGSGFSQTDQTKAYIGMYQDFIATDSRNPQDYRWSKWKGSDGAQGVPGPKGADGRTPYIHFAYAESADGRTGFSPTQTGNKRYMGTYTDFTEADSTDPSRYRWVDMVGTVEVGGRNYIRNSNFSKEGRFWQEYKSSDFGLSFNYAHSRAVDNRNRPGAHFWSATTNTAQFYGLQQTFSFVATQGTRLVVSLLVAKDAGTSGLKVALHYRKNRAIVGQEWKTVVNSSIARAYKRFTFEFKLPADTDELNIMLFGEQNNSSNLYVTDVKLEVGTVATDWSLSPEDVDADISSKADQVLTQEQLNALNERAGVLQAELEAKASLDTLNQLMVAYRKYIEQNDKDKAQSEKDLISLNQRLVDNIERLGELAKRWEFLDTYFMVGQEGLIFGKQNGSSHVKMSQDRFSIFSAGNEVMYISQGTLFIENGIFSKAVQIGRFREEQYHLNADMNVIRYVGG